MNGLVFAVRGNAQAYADAVDADAGYPRAGVDVGPGRHAPPSVSVTLRVADLIAHPTLPSLWAYPEYPEVTAAEVRVPVPGTAVRQALDVAWFPAAVAIAIAEVG